jgi:diaminopimelate decarboxylase
MSDRIPAVEISAVVQRALTAGLIGPADTAVLFHDLGRLRARAEALRGAFPPDTLHAVAVKANPLAAILTRLAEWGFGLEAASWPEVELALASGVPPERVVYDSPAKTAEELKRGLATGLYLNLDSVPELERLTAYVAALPTGQAARLSGRIGVRLNPQVGIGRRAYTSTAGADSKFGIPLEEQRERLVRAFREHAWLQGVHVHVGSQFSSSGMIIDGIRRVLDFALAVNRDHVDPDSGGAAPVRTFDLGGGLPVSYGGAAPVPSLPEHVDRLRRRCPELFDGRFRLITEFGRYLHANAGWTLSRIEYVKEAGGVRTAIIHVGADLLLRECYLPHDWPHELTLLDRDGRLKTAGRAAARPGRVAVAGPLCFTGDRISDDAAIPDPQEGDWLVIHDTGAYTLGMWSRYNSRQVPKVLGIADAADPIVVLKERETIDALLGFWR